MAENSAIEWTDHTFNPWTGCTKVSPACDHCYAEGWAKRSGHVEWGPHGARRRTKPGNWNGPLKWNAEARAKGTRFRVFCASLADVFDNHKSIDVQWRKDLYDLIEKTPHLDWLLLTKRPQNIKMFAPATWLHDNWPAHVWIGTTVENQEEANRRIPYLLAIPAKIRFLSCEPLLGPVQLDDLILDDGKPGEWHVNALDAEGGDPADDPHFGCNTIDWVICGGESGPGARPMHPDWARGLRDQCAAAGVPFFFKQWGEWTPGENAGEVIRGYRDNATWWDNQWLFDKTNMADPEADWDDEPDLYRIGKKRAGRLLDGREWNGMPEMTDA